MKYFLQPPAKAAFYSWTLIAGLFLLPPDVRLSAAETGEAANSHGSGGQDSLDEEILEKAASMSIEELKELLQIYLRKKDPAMAAMIKSLLNKTAPDDPDTKNLVLPAIPAEDSDSDDELVPDDVRRARDLIAEGKAAEAVDILEKLKSAGKNPKDFAYDFDLAGALDEAGLNSRAAAAYEEFLAGAKGGTEERSEARQRLQELRTSEKIINTGNEIDAARLSSAQELFRQFSPEETANPEVKILAARLKILAGDTAGGEAELGALAADTQVSGDIRHDARDALEDSKIAKLLKQGEGASQSGNKQLALKISEELYSLAPLRTEVVYFRARTLLNNKDASQALKLLEQTSPEEDDESAKDHHQLLAEALGHTGAWQRAVASYRLLGADPKFLLCERCDYLATADQLAAFGSPGLSGQWTYTDAAEGGWSVYHAGGQTGELGHRLQILLEAYGDSISPAEGEWSSHAKSEQSEATVAGRLHFGDQNFLQGWLTGHEDGVGAGAAVGRQPVAGPGYQLRYDYQRRATDSLFLRSLNGRQNRLSGSLESDLGHGFSLSLEGYLREVTVNGTSLGQGGGFEISLGKTLIEESAKAPGVTLSYLGEFSKFDRRANRSVFRSLGLGPDEDPLRIDELVDPQVNRHEIALSIHRYWNPRFETSLSGSFGYEFEDEQTVWTAGFKAAYRLDSNLRLTLQADYDSSGQAANASGSVTSLSLGLTMDF